MEYDDYRIRSYYFWDLFLHKEQYPYIGRAYAWALRDDAQLTTDMEAHERKELFEKVLPDWNAAVKKTFQHDWTNVASLGNTTAHLHWHFIPRYRSLKDAYGMCFEDPNPNGNYAPYPKKDIPLETLMQIKKDIIGNLNTS